jgi:hypothetical protein
MIKSIKNPNNPIWNQTRDFPADSNVPQPTEPPNTRPLRQQSQKFYPDNELLSNGAPLSTTMTSQKLEKRETDAGKE